MYYIKTFFISILLMCICYPFLDPNLQVLSFKPKSVNLSMRRKRISVVSRIKETDRFTGWGDLTKNEKRVLLNLLADTVGVSNPKFLLPGDFSEKIDEIDKTLYPLLEIPQDGSAYDTYDKMISLIVNTGFLEREELKTMDYWEEMRDEKTNNAYKKYIPDSVWGNTLQKLAEEKEIFDLKQLRWTDIPTGNLLLELLEDYCDDMESELLGISDNIDLSIALLTKMKDLGLLEERTQSIECEVETERTIGIARFVMKIINTLNLQDEEKKHIEQELGVLLYSVANDNLDEAGKSKLETLDSYIKEIFETFDEQEKNIFTLRYFKGNTLKEIADNKVISLSRESVIQKIDKTLSKLENPAFYNDIAKTIFTILTGSQEEINLDLQKGIIGSLNLSARIVNSLIAIGISTLEELTSYSRREISLAVSITNRIMNPHYSPKIVNDIANALETQGLYLKYESPNYTIEPQDQLYALVAKDLISDIIHKNLMKGDIKTIEDFIRLCKLGEQEIKQIPQIGDSSLITIMEAFDSLKQQDNLQISELIKLNLNDNISLLVEKGLLTNGIINPLIRAGENIETLGDFVEFYDTHTDTQILKIRGISPNTLQKIREAREYIKTELSYTSDTNISLLVEEGLLTNGIINPLIRAGKNIDTLGDFVEFCDTHTNSQILKIRYIGQGSLEKIREAKKYIELHLLPSPITDAPATPR